ncbi:hypothetical protein DRP05_08595, partial [Archaeoglobales archaeon]
MTNLWLRYIDLTIGSLNFNSDNFDIEFKVEKKEDEAKTVIITIYNISQQTREKIKKDDIVELCIVPKNLTLNTLKQLMGYGRLTERKIRYIVRHKRRGKTNR